jgi:pimeloyl-ACP methyl ester carboxylesterase
MIARRTPLILLVTLALAAACSSDPGVSVDSKKADNSESSVPDSEPTDSTLPDTEPGGTKPDDTKPDDTVPEGGGIEWGECTDEDAADDVECATFTVPLDYDDPDGDTLDLALVRFPAQGKREGAVLFNPGGPGASGFTPVAVNGSLFARELNLQNFDMIGFDPRGVDRSNGLRCLTDEQFDKYLYIDSSPDTPEEEALSDESDQVFIDACNKEYGDTLQHYSTANTARDMDAIRAALGDGQLSFIGISYGTYLGAVYATLFPDRVRAFVLDSAYEPNNDTIEQQYGTQAEGFEGAFNNWASWCAADSTCPFTASDVGARWDALKAKLDTTPLTAEDGRSGNNAVMERATVAALYSESEWPVLAAALAAAEQGDPAGIFSLADSYNGRRPDGTFESLFQSNRIIDCASDLDSDVPTDPAALVDYLKGVAPRFSADLEVDDFIEDRNYCADLTNGSEYTELSYDGDGIVVVIGGENDPATPFRWAEELDTALGPNSRLVKFTGEGHGQFLVNSCVTDIEAAALAEGELPDEGAVCEPDPDVPEPDWWSGLPVPDGVSDPVALPGVNAALGITPSQIFAETRITDLSGDEAAEAYAAALEEVGAEALGDNPIGIDGTNSKAYAVDGDVLLVITLSPEAFDTDDLSSAKAGVPGGKTVVLLAFVAP